MEDSSRMSQMGVVAAPQTDSPARTSPPHQRRSRTSYRLPSFRQGPAPIIPGRAGIGLLIAVIAFLAAASGWLWLVQDVPSRTAFIYFADSYPAPFAAPGWIDEDGDRFQLLDGLTLQVESAGFGDGLNSTPWDSLHTALRMVRPQIQRGEVLIVDVRGLGAVTPKGQPALIPPSADPFDATTWILLSEFCQHIEAAAPESQQVHLVLDCLPTRTHWSCGWLFNGFPEAVEAWSEQLDVTKSLVKFTVYCRGGNGETRWRSQTRRGSVLQKALWQGLAGEADDRGNHNGQVDVTELVTSLQESLPSSDPVKVIKFGKATGHLTHALPSKSRDELSLAQRRAEPEVADVELQTAWKQCDMLLKTDLWQKDLPAAGRLLRALSWWENNLWSGHAGVAESAATAREVTRWLSYLQRQSETSHLPAGPYPLLELQQHTGLDAGKLHAAQTLRDELSLAGDRATLAPQSRALAENELLAQTSFHLMASLLAEAAPADSWQDPTLVQRVLSQRSRFESLAIPEDIRVSRRLVSELNEPRTRNLIAFDGLQVGATLQAETIVNALSQGDAALAVCDSASKELHRQLVTCDRMRLEMPFLAEWATIRDANSTNDKDHLVNQLLLPLISGLNDLDARLHPSQAVAGGSTVAPLTVERSWEKLRSQFDDEWKRLLKLRHCHPNDLDALENLLQVPLLARQDDDESRSPADQRMVLLRKLIAAQTQVSDPVTKSPPPQPQVRMLSRWNTHPALVLIGSAHQEQNTTRDDPTLEDWNAEFRNRLCDAEEVESSTVSTKPLAKNPNERLLNSRRGIALTRTSNNVWAEDYRKLAWADLLLWLGDGALAEFWGPLPESHQPLMTTQVDHLMTVVSGLVDSREKEVAALRQRLTAGITATETGMLIDAASLTPVSPSDKLSTKVEIRQNGKGVILPEGIARVGIQPLGDAYPANAVAVPIDSLRKTSAIKDEIPLDPQLVASSFADVNQPLLAEIWLRGNTYRSNFRIIPAGGRVAEVDLDPTAKTTFTVSSQQMRGAAMTFILDCSASMQELIPREGEQGKTPKLTAAISALHGLLSEMTDQSGASVGVMLYGHRASHDPKSQKVILQKRYTDAFSATSGLHPYNDVETILPPGRFGSAELGQVSAHLGNLLPWGETPLYLAVTQAAADFQHLPSDVQRHIVVVTDGRNYQFNPPPGQRVEFADALAKAHAANAVVHVIGFGMSAKEQQAAAAEFTKLASQTGGSSQLDVSRASQLVEKLRSLVGPASFTWAAADGKTHQAPVNEPVTWSDRLPAKLTVIYETATADINLEGGEAAVLLGDATAGPQGQLPSADHTSSNPQFVSLTGGDSPDDQLLVGVHQHQRVGSDAVFTFSLKRANQLYLSQPDGYDISIQPLDESGAEVGEPFVFQGNEYAARMPVPVMQVRTNQWPINAPHANVRLSILDAAAKTAETLALPSASTGQSTLSLGVQWELRQTTNFVQCILRHQANSPGLGTIAVTWVSGPAIKTVRRRLDSEAQIEVHTFIYDQTDAADAPAKIMLAMPQPASRREMHRPLRVTLLGEDGLIAPVAPARQAASLPELVPPALAAPVLLR